MFGNDTRTVSSLNNVTRPNIAIQASALSGSGYAGYWLMRMGSGLP